MSDQPTFPADANLEAALADLGRHLERFPTSDLAHSVRAHLERDPRPPLRRFRRHRGSLLYPLVAAIALAGAALALSPGSRAAVASWFHVIGVRIEFGSAPSVGVGRRLHLGRRVSLMKAQHQAAFPVLVPNTLRPPDEVYIGTPPLVGSVSLLYHSGRGLPRSSATVAGLLITEYEQYYLDVKVLPPGSTADPVTVRGDNAIWIAGLPHVVYDLEPGGTRYATAFVLPARCSSGITAASQSGSRDRSRWSVCWQLRGRWSLSRPTDSSGVRGAESAYLDVGRPRGAVGRRLRDVPGRRPTAPRGRPTRRSW